MVKVLYSIVLFGVVVVIVVEIETMMMMITIKTQMTGTLYSDCRCE